MAVLSFRPRCGGNTFLPTPLGYTHGAPYLRVNIHDESLLSIGAFPGTVLSILVGAIHDNNAHLVLFGNTHHVGILTFPETGGVRFISCHDHGQHTGHYPADEIHIIGAVMELFPHGIDGKRWVYSPPTAQPAEDERLLLRAAAI
jgi:hypothetical protein